MRKATYTFNEKEIATTKILVNVVCYPMTEDKFNKLIYTNSKIKEWSTNILFIGIGYLLKIIIVFSIILFDVFNNTDTAADKNKIEIWEISAFIICLLICVLLKFVAKYSITDRDSLINDIKNYYKSRKDD